MYSFKELLGLFQLDNNITLEDLKRAKTMVLKMHPDKSKLGSQYFLFYKKAFDIILEYYENTVKTTKTVPNTEQIYDPYHSHDKQTEATIAKTMNKMGNDGFQRTFNELFEKNMKKPVEDYNEWFKTHDPLYQFDNVSSTSGITAAFESIKKNTSSLVKHTGVETMNSSGPNFGNLYEDEIASSYITSDPFSKLRFDDLRKVHKDQTVFAVSETDFEKMKTFSSIDQLQRERGSMNITHVDRSESEKILLEREEALKQKMLAKQHEAHLKTMEYAEKNKSVMATFFTLKN
jgi:hypothetical protein